MKDEPVRMTAPLEVGICVADLDRMVRFYVAALGCAEEERRRLPFPATERAHLSADGPVDISFLRTPWGERIKLLAPVAAPARTDDARPEYLTDRLGVAYLTCYVDAIEAVTAGALAAGAVSLLYPPVLPGRVNHIAFVRDPEGNVIELVEPTPEGAG